jgi:hypothetical protein
VRLDHIETATHQSGRDAFTTSEVAVGDQQLRSRSGRSRMLLRGLGHFGHSPFRIGSAARLLNG